MATENLMAASTSEEPRKGLDELCSYQEHLSWLPVPPRDDFHCPEIPKSAVSWAKESNAQLSQQSKYKTELKPVTSLYASDI